MKIKIPKKIEYILDKLIENGFNAHIVGGAVRDLYMGITPSDYDITTNALPCEVKHLFDFTLDTGIKHGTVTVLHDGLSVEVTTYRVDGDYICHRKPKNVSFVSDLKSDLSRRDFTVNAIAYNKYDGIIDYFGGLDDIKNKIIRTVGECDKRFREDALRMLRAVRFSCQLGFVIDKRVLESIERNSALIKYVSRERIKSEFDKILISDNIYNMKYFIGTNLLKDIMPEFDKCFETNQNCLHHIYNVGDHTLQSILSMEKEITLRWVMLFHDLGKVSSRTTDLNGADHFKGHASQSVKIADRIMRELKFSNRDIGVILTLIKLHDIRPNGSEYQIKCILSKFGDDNFKSLLKVQRADSLAQNPDLIGDKLQKIEENFKVYEKIKSENQPYLIKHLAIDGNTLKEMNIPAVQIGYVLNKILSYVIRHSEKNNLVDIIRYVRSNGNGLFR